MPHARPCLGSSGEYAGPGKSRNSGPTSTSKRKEEGGGVEISSKDKYFGKRAECPLCSRCSKTGKRLGCVNGARRAGGGDRNKGHFGRRTMLCLFT